MLGALETVQVPRQQQKKKGQLKSRQVGKTGISIVCNKHQFNLRSFEATKLDDKRVSVPPWIHQHPLSVYYSTPRILITIL